MRTTAVIAALLIVLTLEATCQERDILGYYPSWKWRSRNDLISPARIPYEKLTAINYAFFYPLTDGTIVGRDTAGEALILRGAIDSATGRRDPETSLPVLAHRHRVLLLVSIGGWEDSNNFPEVAAQAQTRAQFAHSCIEHIKTFGFDGIDIDWEYPGYAEHKGTAADRANFPLFLKTIRDSLDAFGAVTGKRYLLTAALPGAPAVLNGFDMEAITPLLDRINIMSYDFIGSWAPTAGHNAALYASGAETKGLNVDDAFRLFRDSLRVPARKLNIGVPFYGHTFAGATNINTPHTGADTSVLGPGGASYHNLVAHMGLFERKWDAKAQVPYLTGKDVKLVVSYDDEQSIGLKARYAIEAGAAGVMIWEITDDVLPDGRTPLLDAINAVFKTARK